MAGFTRWWGCVFSAHAEVVPMLYCMQSVVRRILRARGGSSDTMIVRNILRKYSPRTRR